jgi:excinuclease ABC subunit C
MSNDTDDEKDIGNSLERGAELIRKLVKTLPDAPGVYRMLNEKGEALYVGKAKSLRKRVPAYANTDALSRRLQYMVSQTRSMEFIATHTETEALLLEGNLIKKLQPRYNILLRDDKSFPYLLLTADHDFPVLLKHRGAHKRKGEYFGPFADGGAVWRTLITLQKAFMLRNCSDTMFATRKRPCLQYHIKRCTAPCVGFVDKEKYAAQVADVRDFLSGKSRKIQDRFARKMQEASEAEHYEDAAAYRDRIRALTAVQEHQDINTAALKDADVIGLYRDGARSCIQVFFFRAGQNYGNRAYFPRHDASEADGLILAAFLAQFYENKPVPPEILISHVISEKLLLEKALNEKPTTGRKTAINRPQRGPRKRLVDFAVHNAREALARETLKLASEKTMLEGVAKLFGLEAPPERIEVYDNSHTGGTNMTGAMIVAGPEGLRKNAYRKFNIREAKKSDDYGMMREVIGRRFSKAAQEENGPGTAGWPDLLLIDGGAGQLSSVLETLEETGVRNEVDIVAIAKGEDRNAGREQFFLPGRPPFQLPQDDPVLHYLQRLRDEAHRFAIGAHRARREKQIGASPVDGIPGIGPARKKALLMHFGSGTAVTRAGLADLQAVPGISKAMAEKIYNYFHESA